MRFFSIISVIIVYLTFLTQAHATKSIGVTIQSNEKGVILVDVAENGPAYESGLRDSDIVFSINGKKVKTNAEFIEKTKSSNRTTLSLGVFRGNKRHFFNVKPIDIDLRYYRLQDNIPKQTKLAGELYNNKDYEKAYYLYLQAALLGDSYSQYSVGWMRQYAQGTKKDYEGAKEMYQAAAEKGYISAQYELGQMYLNGDQIPVNYNKAADWLYKAADSGHAGAQNAYGFMFGTEKIKAKSNDNINTSIYWYEKSASQGNEQARKNLIIAKNKKKDAESEDGAFAKAIVESFDALGADISSIERKTRTYSSNTTWMAASIADVALVGAGACAVPVSGYATLPAEFLYLMREVYNSSMGVGFFKYGSPQKDDFANILAIWSGELTIDSDFVTTVAEETVNHIIKKVENSVEENNNTGQLTSLAYQKTSNKVTTKFVAKKAGTKAAGKISAKVAAKTGAKIGAKYAAKAATAPIPIVSAAVCSIVNVWIMNGILDSSVEYFQGLNRIEKNVDYILSQKFNTK